MAERTRLGAVLSAYQQKFDVEAKDLAAEIGIHESSLCRIKQGKLPDARGLAQIVLWLTQPAPSKAAGGQNDVGE